LLTGKERIARILKRQPVDRIGLFEVFWAETSQRWAAEGHYSNDGDENKGLGAEFKRLPQTVEDHFRLDLRRCPCLNMVADLDFGEPVVEETEDLKLIRNGNGALLRWHKKHSGAPEHVDFMVKDRSGWQESIREHLLNSADYVRRIDFDLYRRMKQKCQNESLFLTVATNSVFECMHPVCGHENLLMGMALDPEWVRDMCDVYVRVIIDLLEILFEKEGQPDGMWFWEDMGFKEKPFMSPAMYRDLLFPAHRRLFDWAHSRRMPVIVHSCGFVEPLVPGLVEAGIDCLQPMEVKAGMDLLRLKKNFGDRIAFMGGLDVRTLIANDLDAVRAELEKKVPVAMEGSGYILQVDHSVPDQVDYETYQYFVEKGLEIGTYGKTR